MKGNPLTPRITKAGLFVIKEFLHNKLPQVIEFQFNPDTMTRTLQPQGAGEGGASSELLRLKGAPIETIRLDAEFDITDQVINGNPLVMMTGLIPQLSALEMLIHPSTESIRNNMRDINAGMMEILPSVAPLVLFTWGINRLIPVKINELSIVEEAYDTVLNPIRAKVTLGLRVLSNNDLSPDYWAYYLSMSQQIRKEFLAAESMVGSAVRDVQGVVHDII